MELEPLQKGLVLLQTHEARKSRCNGGLVRQSIEGSLNGSRREKQRVRRIPHMDIGKRLRKLREAKGWSQYVIAERAGILRCNIWRMEKGQLIPGLETLATLARALEVDLYELFLDGEGERQATGLRRLSMPGAERRKQFETLKKLDKRDRKLLLDLAQKMASKNQPAG